MNKIILRAISLTVFVFCMSAAINAQSSAPVVQNKCAKLKMAVGEEDADMGGKRYQKFVFTNLSDKPCTLRGFPTFVVLNKAGKALANGKAKYSNDYPNGPAERDRKPVAVTLAPGKTAWFQIYYNDGMALDHKGPYPKAYKFLITAPRGDKAFVTRTDIEPCCGIIVGSVRAVEAGQ
ncbi:MAG: DUF4232 domain-containing protein [Pyrinomonadaceae bacterium]